MRAVRENLDNLGQMANPRAGKPEMRRQTVLIRSRPPAKLDAIFAHMLVALGDAVNRKRKCADREGIDGEGI